MTRLPRLALAVLCLAGAALVPLHAAQKTSDDQLVATVGGTAITLDELEAFRAAELERIDRERHLVLEQGVGPLIEQRLLDGEAKRRGVSVEELLQAEIEARTEPVTDQQVETWYQENAARLQGRPKEQVLPQIEAYLIQQATVEARAALLDELRAKHEVVVHFEPLRTDLELEEATFKGAEGAPVTIVEFSDFQCPACRSFNPILAQVVEEYGDRVRVAFRQFPLRSIHPQAQAAAEASLCAREQDQFWQLHDAMFEDQRSLAPAQLKATARRLELDGEAFDQCLDSGRYRELVERDLARGQRAGVSGTPSVFVNGREVSPGQVPSLAQMKALIDDELQRASK